MTTNQIASLLKEAKELTFDYAIVDEASKCSFEDLRSNSITASS